MIGWIARTKIILSFGGHRSVEACCMLDICSLLFHSLYPSNAQPTQANRGIEETKGWRCHGAWPTVKRICKFCWGRTRPVVRLETHGSGKGQKELM